MKTYKKYAFLGLNVLCLAFITISFVSLRESIQIERQKQEVNERVAFVSDAILPSTPRVINVPKATVKKTVKTVNYNNNYSAVSTASNSVLATYTGNISHYAADCSGCIGITASGYDVRSGNTLYYDKTYGNIHVVAGDAKFSFGTIIRFTANGKSRLAIVLDRGGIGFGRKFLFDLLCESEDYAYQLGVLYNAKIEVLRYGF